MNDLVATGSDVAAEPGPTVIERPYLLVMMLPTYVDVEGRRHLERLWHKDLVRHLPHLKELRLAAPAREHEPDRGDLLPVEEYVPGHHLEFVDLPPCRTGVSTLATLPRAIARLWDAVGRAEIVHGNVGGWPISYSWFAVPMARLRGKFVLMNMESGAWRTALRRPWALTEFLRALAFEGLGRFCVNQADLMTCTHAGYRDSMLLPWRRWRGHVIQASWVDAENVLSRDEARARWEGRLADLSRPLRVAFAANLLPNKGVGVLLDALDLLDQRGTSLGVDIYGQGPMLARCAEVAKRLERSTHLRMAGTLPYGPAFFGALDAYDVMAVPSLSDEQPRIIYDAFARALPVIASDTPGTAQCDERGVASRLVPQGDPRALAEALVWATEHRSELRTLGLAALEIAREMTHDRMHERRAALLRRELERRRGRALPGPVRVDQS
jgi:glycosyltransferase involved in cell wall biosynthesis